MSDYEVKNVEAVVVSNDIQVRVFTLAQGNVIPWHYHSESTDHYFVLRGALTIQTRGPENRRELTVGERYKILPGTVHYISNESASECQFLLVQVLVGLSVRPRGVGPGEDLAKAEAFTGCSEHL